jgi:hypothetical protein
MRTISTELVHFQSDLDVGRAGVAFGSFPHATPESLLTGMSQSAIGVLPSRLSLDRVMNNFEQR